MINYTEKGSGLHQRIAKAGYELREENGEWVSSDDVAVQLLIDSYSLDDAKSDKCDEVLAKAKTLRDKAVKSISPGEMAGWTVKINESANYALSGDSSVAPMLSSEAAIRGITLDELCAKVRGNASGFVMLEAAIAGVDGKHRDAIKALTTFEEVGAYSCLGDWPEV